MTFNQHFTQTDAEGDYEEAYRDEHPDLICQRCDEVAWTDDEIDDMDEGLCLRCQRELAALAARQRLARAQVGA